MVSKNYSTTEFTLDPLIYEARKWRFLGKGKRHCVLSHETLPFVVRLETSGPGDLNLSVRFHNQYLSELLDGFICPISLAVFKSDFIAEAWKSCRIGHPLQICQDSPCVLTRNLIGMTTIELKPKYRHIRNAEGVSVFVQAQIMCNESVVFDPEPVFEGKDLNSVRTALTGAWAHRKEYLKIHSNLHTLMVEELLSMLGEAILTEPMRKVFNCLEKLHSCATDEHAKLARSVVASKEDCVLDLNFSEKTIPTKEELSGLSVHRPGEFLLWFLAGRMAMDVSLMFNFFRDSNPFPELTTITLENGWFCSVGIVDTELKPTCKIPYYASQFDS